MFKQSVLKWVRFKPVSVTILVGICTFALPGCSILSYYSQAVGGQWSLLRGRVPVEGLLANPATPPGLRTALASTVEIRRFAQRELALPVEDTYSTYTALDREAVVWNLVAAPQYSLELKAWCYPVVGCQNYRGYFDRAAAQAAAGELDPEHWDTWVAGVSAYSSLGWFEDPLLSTFIHWPEDQLAALIFHELSHKVVYVDGDTTFNESYATAVELEGLSRYFARSGRPAEFQAAVRRQAFEREFVHLVTDAADQLKELYSQPDASDSNLGTGKKQVLDTLRNRFRLLQAKFPVVGSTYAGFFDAGLNNARIASVGTYNRWVPAFRQLLRDNDGDFAQFHDAVKQLAALPQTQREQRLRQLELKRLDEDF